MNCPKPKSATVGGEICGAKLYPEDGWMLCPFHGSILTFNAAFKKHGLSPELVEKFMLAVIRGEELPGDIPSRQRILEILVDLGLMEVEC